MSTPHDNGTPTSATVPVLGRRLRALAGLGLVCGLLLASSACSSDDDGSPLSSSDGTTDSQPGGDPGVVIDTMKVCDTVDLAPLEKVLQSPGYEFGPEDIPRGVGVDPGGPQCAAQLKLPALGQGDAKQELVPARLNVAVVAYGDRAEADKQYQDRIGASKKFEGSQVEQLTGGDWTRGEVVSATSASDNLVHALVQKDTYLVKIYLQVSSDESYSAKLPFTHEQVRAQVVSMMRADLFPAVDEAVTA